MHHTRTIAPADRPGPAFARAVMGCAAPQDLTPGRYTVTVGAEGGVAVRWESYEVTHAKPGHSQAVKTVEHLESMAPTSPTAVNLRGILTALRHGLIR